MSRRQFIPLFLLLAIFNAVATGRALGQDSSPPATAPAADCATDDVYEDNDSFGTAAPLTPGSYPTLTLCTVDPDDYFTIEVPAGHTLHADANFANIGPLKNLHIYLYDTDMVEISHESRNNGSVSTQMTVAEDGVYFARLFWSAFIAGSTSYDLALHLSCEACIGYQGRLSQSGVEADGLYEFEFGLYETITDGLPIAGPITRTVPVTSGLFAANLYFGETVTHPGGEELSGARYLDIGVRQAGSSDPFTALTPRQALTPAPAARTLQPGAVISGTVEDGGVLTVYNGGFGYGVVVEDAGYSGVWVQQAGEDGFVVCATGAETTCTPSGGEHGLEVGNAQDDGVHIVAAGEDGVEIGSTGGYGLLVTDAFSDGVRVNSAGFFGVRVEATGASGLWVDSAGGAGLYVNEAQTGVTVADAARDGFFVCSTGSETGCTPSGGNHGLEVGNAQGSGVHVNSAGGDGIFICATGSETSCTAYAGNSGLEIGNAQHDGVRITSAGEYGVYVRNTVNGDGLFVCSTGSETTCTSHVSEHNGLEVGRAQDNGVRVESAGEYGMLVEEAGFDGLRVFSADDDGIDIDSAGDFAGEFGGNISVSGSCSGCLLATFALNEGKRALQPGDVVAVLGATNSPFPETKTLFRVVPAAPGLPLLGVVQGYAEVVTEEQANGNVIEQLVPRDQSAEPGEYVSIIIYGPVQLAVGAEAVDVAVGDRLTVSENGSVRALQTRTIEGMVVTESAHSLGIALSEPDKDGMVWVLVNPQ